MVNGVFLTSEFGTPKIDFLVGLDVQAACEKTQIITFRNGPAW
jgi:hypothetical protein